ncbi:pyridoxal-phosphate dependent enzyme [Nitrincola sp. MINF-07-Sa-05]|uniref:pyridoxal-phosphate dependent enzyme n=1 Tax=Nitrincola salilacus TaxID=3400273 RepID=UPI003917FCB4
MPLHIQTPLLESRAIPRRDGQRIWMKMEALQPPGSFKIRGIGYACQLYQQRGARRFISSSGGNAGIAVAYAGRHLDVPVVVVVPETTSERARQLIRQENAELVVYGSSWQEANELAQSMQSEGDAFLHPFDDPLLWQGHASMIDEVAASGLQPDAVVLSVGGGGLLCGVVEGLQRNGWGGVPVVAVETLGADSLHQSLQQNARIQLPGISSIATSLGARQVCEQSLILSERHPLQSLVVSDHQALQACERFLDDHRMLVEPACGATLALAYEQQDVLAGYRNLLLIVCGGVTASYQQIQQWQTDHRGS